MTTTWCNPCKTWRKHYKVCPLWNEGDQYECSHCANKKLIVKGDEE